MEDWKVGDIALITDHINYNVPNPLIGPNRDLFPPHSVRFVDMSNCYDKKLREIAKEVGAKQGVSFREGVYFGLTGPSYETCFYLFEFLLLLLFSHIISISFFFPLSC